ncbi:hypothetical protein SPFL3102_00589 [Sporomusaceae bacterium FL31]|nr:hypothetical protein SPFL3101_01362 [Sporomusaceae bacterium FL31]GCE32792.1 hypothetical protein SPFL3102_00589 [Sporomusaceae bacterium]
MINKISVKYFFKLKLKSPTSLALETDFQKLTCDISEAVEFFNQKFRGIKEIILSDVEFSIISLILNFEYEPKEQVTAKELTVFSRYLHNEKEWVRFSRERTKLFIPITIIKFTDEDLLKYVSTLGRNLIEYERYFNRLGDDAFDKLYSSENIKYEFYNPKENEGLNSDMTEEQIIAIIKFLFATKDLGPAPGVFKKNQAIEDIKKILIPWVLNS